jgi:hypothetical protein
LVDDGSHPRYIGDSKKSTEWFGRKNPQIVIRYVKMIPISTSYEKTAWFVRSIWENVSLIWGGNVLTLPEVSLCLVAVKNMRFVKNLHEYLICCGPPVFAHFLLFLLSSTTMYV